MKAVQALRSQLGYGVIELCLQGLAGAADEKTLLADVGCCDGGAVASRMYYRKEVRRASALTLDARLDLRRAPTLASSRPVACQLQLGPDVPRSVWVTCLLMRFIRYYSHVIVPWTMDSNMVEIPRSSGW